MPKLQIIVRHGVRLDAIDVKYAEKKNIIVHNTLLANINLVAEHIIELI
jgi:phosphoglycerate dehydrogenase-like enzyme